MKLFIAHVGFYDNDIGIYELHSNIFVVAPDARTAKDIVKSKPIFIHKRMHIDGIQEIQQVDGYEIKLEAAQQTADNTILTYTDVKNL
jgi:hypothetical protein